MKEIEISQNRIPQKFWICHFVGKEEEGNEELAVALMKDLLFDKYYMAVYTSKFNIGKLMNSPLNSSLDFMEKTINEFVDSLKEKYQDSGKFAAAKYQVMTIKGGTADEIAKDLQDSGIFEVTVIEKKVSVATDTVPILSPESELTDLLVKHKQKELRELVNKITVEKLTSQYGEPAITNFLKAIKFKNEK